jgi:hypothetical protein
MNHDVSSVQVCPAGTNTLRTVWLVIVVVQVPLPVAACAGADAAAGLADELHPVTSGAATIATPSAAAAGMTSRRPIRARTSLNMDSPLSRTRLSV